ELDRVAALRAGRAGVRARWCVVLPSHIRSDDLGVARVVLGNETPALSLDEGNLRNAGFARVSFDMPVRCDWVGAVAQPKPRNPLPRNVSGIEVQRPRDV